MTLKYTRIPHADDNVDPDRVEFIFDGKVHRYSALPFFTFAEADGEIATLNSLANFSFVAKAYYALKDQYRDDFSIAVIEEVSSLPSFLKNNEEGFCFWEYNSDGSKCIGMGNDFIRIAFQTARAIEKVHRTKRFHGNLKSGIMIGFDNNVRLCNFSTKERQPTDKECAIGQRNDLMQFMSILKEIAKVYPPVQKLPPSKTLQIPYDLSYYFSLMNFNLSPNTLSDVEEVSKWFFHAPIYWKSTINLLFLDRIDQHFDMNASILSGSFGQYGDWRTTLEAVNEQTIIDCFKWGSPHYNKSF